jgi:hypothetical protein
MVARMPFELCASLAGLCQAYVVSYDTLTDECRGNMTHAGRTTNNRVSESMLT